jgi:hypothetical protein
LKRIEITKDLELFNYRNLKIFVFFVANAILFAQQTDFQSERNLADKQTQQLVEAYIKKGDAETDNAKAIVHFTNALELSPRDGNIHIKIADRYKNMNQSDLALSSFRNGMRFGGDTTHAMFQQAQILKELSLKDGLNVNLAVEAARRYGDVYLRDPSRIDAVKNRGILQFLLAENSVSDAGASKRLANEAIIMLKKCIEINASDKEVKGYLRKAYILLGDAENANLWL